MDNYISEEENAMQAAAFQIELEQQEQILNNDKEYQKWLDDMEKESERDIKQFETPISRKSA